MSWQRWAKISGIVFLVLVGLAAVGFRYWRRTTISQDKTGAGKIKLEEAGDWKRLEIPQRQPPFFTLEPAAASKYGVPPNNEFILKTREPVEEGLVQKNLKATFAVNVVQISTRQFRLVPKNNLGLGQTLKISIAADRDYGWAYQTQGKFRVTSTIPGDKAVRVPVNTGMELVFSQDDYTDPTPFVTISPSVRFRSERHGEMWSLVPLSPLAYKTVYTVTVKKGLNLTSRHDPIADDLVFTFQTQEEPQPQNIPQLNVRENLVEVSPKDPPVVKVFTGNWKSEQTVAAEIYKYRSGADFAKAAAEAEEKQSRWYTYFTQDEPTDTSRLAVVGKAEVKPQSKDNLQFLQLPEPLPEGFYLVQWWYNNHGKLQETWIQSTSVAGYVSVGKQQTLVWVNDLDSGEAVNGAGVRIAGGSQYYTSGNGIAVFSTAKGLFEKSKHFAAVSVAGEEKLYLPISSLEGNSRPGEVTADDFWSYLYHERRLYKPTDTVNFWGVVKNRESGLAPEKAEVVLTTGYGEQKKTVQDWTTGVNSDGTFAGKLELADAPAGWYYLEARVGNVVITSAGLEVKEFAKPEMKIEVSSDKKALFAGEKMTFVARTSFFDGTPGRNIELNVHEDQSGKVTKMTTDAKGEVRYEYQPQYSGDSRNYPRYESITVNPALAQQTTVEGYGSGYIFGARIMLSTESRQEGTTAKIKATVNRVDLARFDSGQPDGVRGAAAANKELVINIKKTWWERVEQGTYYDFVEKTTRPAYNYVRHEEKQPEVKLTTNAAGGVEWEFGMEKERGYEVTAKVSDEEGRSVERTEYFYYYEGGTFDYSRSENKRPELKLVKKENSYAIGEEVKAVIEQGGKAYPENNKFLFMTAVRGRQDYFVQDGPELAFAFGAKHAPNAYIGAVIFTGKGYRAVAGGCEWEWYCQYEGGGRWNGVEIRYRKEDSLLTVEAEPGQEKYRPGEKAEVTVKVSRAGQPMAGAEVNVAAVDQALAAIGGVVAPDILNSLYRPVAGMMYYTYFSHKPALPDEPAAEKGGGGGEFREIFKDTAFFGRAKTDNEGKAVVAFELPDNLTTWIVYAQAVTADLDAGQTESRIVASQEFFVTSQFPRKYLVHDLPVLAANSFGSGLEDNAVTQYTVSFFQGEREIKKLTGQGEASREAGFEFPRLEKGEYKAGVRGKLGDKEDGVLLPFEVVESNWNLDYATSYRVEAGKSLAEWNLEEAAVNRPITIIVADAGKGRYYYQLKSYCWTGSSRVEKAIARIKADQMLVEKFADKGCQSEGKKLADWQAADGGLGQVWWGGSNLEATVWGLMVDNRLWEGQAREKMGQFLENKTKGGNTGTIQKILGYWGLGMLQEAGMGNLQQLAAGSVSFEEKVKSALALAYLGDIARAREMYYDLLADYAYAFRPYIRIQRDNRAADDVNKMVNDSAQMLLLGSLVEKNYNAGLAAYIRDFKGQAEEIILDLAQMAFVNEELAKLPPQDTSVTVNNSGNKQNFNLVRGNSRTFDVPPQNIGGFSLTVNQGLAEVTTNYTLGADGAIRIPKDDRLKIKRSWRKAKGSGDKIVPGDIIEIKIEADVAEMGPQGEYVITDYLPAGLVYVENPNAYGLTPSGWTRQTENNIIKAYFYDSLWWRTNRRPIVYYARAATAGMYTAEPAVFQSTLDRAVIQTTGEETVNIDLN